MKTESIRRHNQYLFAVTAILLVVLTTLLTAMQSGNASQVKESEVNRSSRYGIDLAEIPPIDAAVPSLVETASFGLG